MTDAVANLQKSLGLAEHAATLSPPDESLRYREGLVEVFLGDVFFKLGERPESLLHYHRALGRLDPIARRGDNVRAVSNAAVTQGKIGDVFLVDGKLLQALPYYREAQLVQSRLAASDRHNDRLQISEAIGLVELGNVLVGLGRVPEGMEYMRHALVKIQAEPNATSNVRSTEVLIRCWLGGGLERQGDVRAASEQYAAGKELLRPMRAGSTNSPRIQEYYATVTDRRAASLDKLGETDKATDEYEEARRVLEPLVKADPEDQELAYALAETYTALGTVVVERAERSRRREDKLADWQAAAAWFRQALDVWSRIPHPARMSTSGFEVTPPAEVLRRLERCTRELQSAAAAPAPRR
jgi:tetratricopeptide (TPR) repeat protein